MSELVRVSQNVKQLVADKATIDVLLAVRQLPETMASAVDGSEEGAPSALFLGLAARIANDETLGGNDDQDIEQSSG